MANTYSQIYIHIVFTVQGRQNLIKKDYQEELQKYITGIIRNNKQKLIAVKAMPDHVHTLIGVHPDIAISNLVRDIKNNSSSFINRKRWIRGKFKWQEGFGAFSYSQSQIDRIVKYIQDQPIHHQKKTFREEYTEMLKKFKIEYDPKYIFDIIEIESD